MPIKCFPNRIIKGKVPAIDRVMAKRTTKTATGHQDTTAAALDQIVSADSDWIVDNISLRFSAATARNYSVRIRNGRKVVSTLNDYLYIRTADIGPQKITLTAGFYTGAQLATELQTRLNANASFLAAGITFTVAYVTTTGLFTITPNAGTVQYLDYQANEIPKNRESIAGYLFGLTANTAFLAAITSDTAVYGLNTETGIINQTASTVVEHYHDDIHTLSVDQALHIESSTGVAIVVDYTVVYEEIV